MPVETIGRTALLARRAANPGLVIVHALPRAAYDRGHIPGAISIPSEQVIDRAPDLLPDRNAEIVVYCKNGPCRRSEWAAERLARLGYSRVRDYHDGRDDWTGAGLPLEGTD